MRRGAHVQQRALHLGTLGLDVDAADQISLVLFVGHPAGCAAGRAALAQRKHAGPLRVGGEECIGVQAYQQVRLHPPGFLHPHMQGHEVVCVPRQKGPHGHAFDTAVVDALAQQVGKLQHHVFLAGAAGANGAGVFATMARIERDDDHAVDTIGLCGSGWRCGCWLWRRRGRFRSRRRGRYGHGYLCGCGVGWWAGAAALRDQLAQRIRLGCSRCGGRGLRFVAALATQAQALVDQGIQRVRLGFRIQIKHQPVPVGRHGCQRKNLRAHRLLEIQYQTYDLGTVLADPDVADVGVVCAYLAHQLFERRVERKALDVDRQARRIGDETVRHHQRRVRFDGDPRVIGCGPDAHVEYRRAPGEVQAAQAQDHGPAPNERTPLHHGPAQTLQSCAPRTLWPRSSAVRQVSPVLLRCSCKSAVGK